MKLIAFFIFIASLQLNAKGHSQTVTLSLRNVPLQKVFKLIQKQTGYNFLYTNELLNDAGKVNIEIQNGSLFNALQIALENTGLTYSILEGTVVIKKRLPVNENLKLIPDLPPPVLISGRITNEQGEPLPNVSVVVKGGQIGTSTDSKGYYSINVPDNSSKILVFSFVGMGTQEINVSKNATVSLMMKAISGPEQEVVVRGYGTQKKVNLTGSVASIGGDQIQNRPVTTISAAIQGELPGVQVVTPSGQPGRDNGIIKIRGVGTMNDADPMVVVDGLVSTMDDLNPNDIESVSVLKDASASAIYGSRAANGVILITTKRGKTGKPKISYNGYLGKQSFTATKQFLDSYNYAVLMNEGLTNEGLPVKYTADEIEKFRTGSDPVNYPNTDWMKLLHQGSGNQQSHNVSVSGGSDASRYLLSVGYLNQLGLLKNTSTYRYNVRFNLDSKVSDHLALGVTSSLSRQNIVEPSAGIGPIVSLTERQPPVILNKNPDGTWNHYLDGNGIESLEEGGLLTDNVSHVNGNIFAELTIVKGLKLRATAGVDYNMLDRETHVTDVTFGDGLYQGPNSLTDVLTRSTRVILQSFLTYQTSLGKHNISGLLGVERESNRLDYDDAYRNNFPSNVLTELNGGSASSMTNTGYSIENNLGSYFGRVNYDYKGKYLVEGTMRYDGSSKFAADRRWGLFPSFSAGWRISQEPFMQHIRSINNLKVRVSYGSVGNNATADYQYLPIISLGQNYPFFGTIAPGAAQTTAFNPKLEWEKSTSFNIGVDLGLFNEKLTFTADYYNRLTTNILTAVPVSVIFGLPAPTVNEGALRNKGFEFSLGYKNRAGAFSYHSSFNISINQNRVEKFAYPAIGAVGAFGSLYTTIRAVGYQWDEFYGIEAIGIYQTDQQVQSLPKVTGSLAGVGDLIFKDQNKDGVIDGADRVALGNEVPSVTFGINLGFNYKNFDVSLFGQGVTDVTQKITIQDMYAFVNGAGGLKRNLDTWTPQTPNSKFPKTHVTEQYNEDQLNSASLIDASYFRLKNLQVGYTLPQNMVRRAKIDQVRIYISCSNLFTLTHMFSGIDPEAASVYDVGYDGKYNNVRVVTFGLNINL